MPRLARHGSKAALSVLVPVYNSAAYLEECLESLARQTQKDIEFIVIDDGSTDPLALEIMERYSRNQGFKIIHKANSGYGDSLNIGLEMATGSWLGIVESDDFIHPRMYEILLKAASKNNVDVAKADFAWFMDYRGKRLYQKKRLFENPDMYNRRHPATRKDFFRTLIYNQVGIYRNKFIQDYNIRFNVTPGAAFQDNGFFFQLMAYASTFYFVDEFLYFLRRDNPSSSVKNPGKANVIFEEYKFIADRLGKGPYEVERFNDVFLLRKFRSYIFHLKRIDASLKQEFAHRFAAEFKIHEEEGKLNLSCFDSAEKELLEALLVSPDAFLETNKRMLAGGESFRNARARRDKELEGMPEPPSQSQKAINEEFERLFPAENFSGTDGLIKKFLNKIRLWPAAKYVN